MSQSATEEFEFAPDIIPYLDGTVEWNPTNERFEGCFWGEVELPGYKLLGWITVNASYADNYQPIQYEVHDVIDLETGESDPDHSLFGKILMVADTLMKLTTKSKHQRGTYPAYKENIMTTKEILQKLIERQKAYAKGDYVDPAESMPATQLDQFGKLLDLNERHIRKPALSLMTSARLQQCNPIQRILKQPCRS